MVDAAYAEMGDIYRKMHSLKADFEVLIARGERDHEKTAKLHQRTHRLQDEKEELQKVLKDREAKLHKHVSVLFSAMEQCSSNMARAATSHVAPLLQLAAVPHNTPSAPAQVDAPRDDASDKSSSEPKLPRNGKKGSQKMSFSKRDLPKSAVWSSDSEDDDHLETAVKSLQRAQGKAAW